MVPYKDGLTIPHVNKEICVGCGEMCIRDRGKDLYENSALAKELFEKANDILGYRITDIMFDGTDEDPVSYTHLDVYKRQTLYN